MARNFFNIQNNFLPTIKYRILILRSMHKILFFNIRFNIVIFTILLSGTTYSQQLVLTYDDAIDMAIKQNINIQQQSNLLRVTKTNNFNSLANFLPSINFNSSAFRTKGLQYSNEKSALVDSTIDQANYNLSAEVTLFNGFGNIYRLMQSYQLNIAQEKKLERTVQDVIFQASQSFLQLLLDKELVAIDQKDFEVQKRLLEQIEALVKTNTRTQADLLSQEADLKSSEVDLIKIKNQLFIDKVNFAKLLVIETGKEFDIIAPIWNIDTILNQNYRLDSLLILATKSRPDMAQLKAEEKAAFHDFQVSHSASWPKLTAFYNYGSFYSSDNLMYNPDDHTFHAIPFKEQILHENYSSQFGFKLNIPLFNRLTNRAIVVKSKISYENAKIIYKDSERQLYLDVQREYQNFVFYKESYNAKKILAEVALRSYEKQYELYRMGNGNIVTLNLENQKNIKAQSEKIQAEYTLVFQRIILNYYLGTLKAN